MSIIEDIKNFRGRDLLLLLCLFVAIVSLGIIILYHVKPHLVSNGNVTVLVLLSASLTLPLFAFHTLLSRLFFNKWETKTDKEKLQKEHFVDEMTLVVASVLTRPSQFEGYTNH